MNGYSKYSMLLLFHHYQIHPRNILILVLMLQSGLTRTDSESDSNNKLDGIGRIVPSGEIIIDANQSLELFCILNLKTPITKNFTSKNLIFKKDGKLVDQQFVTRLNETTVRLSYLPNVEESNTTYYCYLFKNVMKIPNFLSRKAGNSNESDYVHFSDHQIGTTVSNWSTGDINTSNPSLFLIDAVSVLVINKEPRGVTDIKCVSELLLIVCLWNVPYNYAETKYSGEINYFISSGVNTWFPISDKCSNDNAQKNICVWYVSTPKIAEVVRLKITSENNFSKIEQNYTFNHLEHVRPSKTIILFPNKTESTSILMQWNIDKLLQYYLPAWIFQINYTCLDCTDSNDSRINTIRLNESSRNIKYYHNVTNLQPNSKYQFAIRMKSSISPPFDIYWSSFSVSEIIKTNVLPPPHAPEIYPGLFQIHHISGTWLREVTIYWDPLHVSKGYGDIRYEVSAFKVDENGNQSSVNITDEMNISNSSTGWVEFRRIHRSAYRFKIRSINSAGKSPNESFIDIPATHNEVKHSTSFYCVRYDYGRTVPDYYRLYSTIKCYWKSREDQPDILSYTLFWFTNPNYPNEQFYGPNVRINWTHIPTNSTTGKYKVVHMFWKFTSFVAYYLSANVKNSSSSIQPPLLWLRNMFFSNLSQNDSNGTNKNSSKGIIETVSSRNASSRQNRLNIGWRLSENQHAKWMGKLAHIWYI